MALRLRRSSLAFLDLTENCSLLEPQSYKKFKRETELNSVSLFSLKRKAV